MGAGSEGGHPHLIWRLEDITPKIQETFHAKSCLMEYLLEYVNFNAY
jgi:hypothetical protein